MKETLKNLREYFRMKKKISRGHIELPLKLRGVKYIHIGKNFKLRKNYRIECIDRFASEELHPEFVIGNGVIINYNFTAFISDKCSIGDNTIIASNVMITTENHGINPEHSLPYAQQPLTSGKVEIGKNVWVGQNVIIMAGVTIGDNAVVGAGSIVTKNVSPLTMVAGNPAKNIKRYDMISHQWIKWFLFAIIVGLIRKDYI